MEISKQIPISPAETSKKAPGKVLSVAYKDLVLSHFVHGLNFE